MSSGDEGAALREAVYLKRLRRAGQPPYATHLSYAGHVCAEIIMTQPRDVAHSITIGCVHWLNVTTQLTPATRHLTVIERLIVEGRVSPSVVLRLAQLVDAINLELVEAVAA